MSKFWRAADGSPFDRDDYHNPQHLVNQTYVDSIVDNFLKKHNTRENQDINNLIREMLTYDPSKRPSMDEFVSRLGEIIQGREIG